MRQNVELEGLVTQVCRGDGGRHFKLLDKRDCECNMKYNIEKHSDWRIALRLIVISLLLPIYCFAQPDIVIGEEQMADEFFYEGKRMQLLGKQDDAFQLFSHSLELNPNSAAAYYELSSYYIGMRQDSIAESMVKKAVELAPDNYWYKNALVSLYASANKIDDALKVLEDMSVQYPQKTDVLAMLEGLYSSKHDYANVIKTLNKIEQKEGKSEELSLEKFRTYIQMKDEKSAYNEMVALADEYPNDLRYRVLIGDLLLDSGKKDEAFAVYKEVEALDSTNLNLKLSLAQYYSDTQQDSLYQAQLEKVITDPKMDRQKGLAIMNGIILPNVQHNSDTTKIMSLFRKILSYPQPDGDMAELCVRYMIARNAPQNDIKPILHQMLSIDPENVLARSQLLQYAVEENDTNGIVKVCKPAVDFGIDDPIFYYYLGIAYFQQDSSKDAIDVLKKGLTHVKDNSNLSLLTNSYTLIGDLYHKIGMEKEAFEAYDSCLIYRPEDPMVLNNYAYYLSLLKKDLRRAEQMSRLSLQKDSANYTFIDTYAWILFQQKKYAEAKVYIDEAMNIMMQDSIQGEDANIIEHAGDIYSKCGLTQKALEYWQKALQLGSDQNIIIERKIKKRKYLED